MSGFPRAALGSLGNRPAPSAMAWALAGYLTRRGIGVRHFHSQACYCAPEGALAATGSRSRHLDSWLMSRELCRSLLAEAYAAADFVLVEGRFADARPSEAQNAPNSSAQLDALCRVLDLPRLIVLDAALTVDCRIPPRPDAVDGVLIDGVLSFADYVRIQTCVEGAWGVPVLGGLERREPIRQLLASLPAGAEVPRAVCEELANSFGKFVDQRALDAACDRASYPIVQRIAEARAAAPARRPVIALAYDAAFCGYFPDVIEILERRGARVVNFSPLTDESLPDQTESVLLGCGRTDLFAEQLAANFCMLSAVHDFARRGGRIYSEGGGTAYLSRSLRSVDGHDYSMANVLPLAASRKSEPCAPEPIEFQVDAENWILPRHTTMRGYRSRVWNFKPQESVEELTHDVDGALLFQAGAVVGGPLQLHLAAVEPAMLALGEPQQLLAAHYVGIDWPT